MSKNASSDNEYLLLVEEARKRQIKLNNKQIKRIRNLYREVAKNLEVKANKAKKGSLTERWIKDYKKAVEQEIRRINGVLFTQISDSILESANIPIGIQLNFFSLIDNKYKGNIDKSFASMFSNVPNKVLYEITNGDIYKDGRGLSKRLWWNEKKVNGDIDYIIQKGIAEKKSAFELAEDLQTYLNPDTKKDFEFKSRYGNKRVEYNSFRLAITSISHAYQLSMKRSCKMNPFVTGIQWHISNSTHRKTCELCKSRDGKIYPADELPLDHPMGMCHFTPVILDSMEDIGTRLNKWGKGGNDKKLDEWYKKYGAYFAGEEETEKSLKDIRSKAKVKDKGIDSNSNNGIIKENDLLPNGRSAIIPEPKIKGYALNMNHPTGKDKAVAFETALGYNQENADDLINNIQVNIRNYRAMFKDETQYGKRYEIIMNLKGANGKTANVLTAWMIKNGDDFPTLTSAYVTKKKVK